MSIIAALIGCGIVTLALIITEHIFARADQRRHAWTSHLHPSDDGRLHPCISHQQCKNCATTRRKA